MIVEDEIATVFPILPSYDTKENIPLAAFLVDIVHFEVGFKPVGEPLAIESAPVSCG